MCASMCVFAFQRGFAMFGPTTLCVLGVYECVKQSASASERVLQDVCVLVCGGAALGFGSVFL